MLSFRVVVGTEHEKKHSCRGVPLLAIFGALRAQ